MRLVLINFTFLAQVWRIQKSIAQGLDIICEEYLFVFQKMKYKYSAIKVVKKDKLFKISRNKTPHKTNRNFNKYGLSKTLFIFHIMAHEHLSTICLTFLNSLNVFWFEMYIWYHVNYFCTLIEQTIFQGGQGSYNKLPLLEVVGELELSVEVLEPLLRGPGILEFSPFLADVVTELRFSFLFFSSSSFLSLSFSS